MDCYDVIVVGLGGMGSSAAYHLARRGARVLGLEQFTPGHTHGSSHGHSRVIRQAYFEDPAYVPLLLRAYDLWSSLELESGTSLVQITGGLMMGMESSAVFQGSLRSARQHRLHHEVLDAKQIHQRFPELHPNHEVGLYESLAGVVRPEAAIRAHLHLAQKWGCEIHSEEPVLDWRADESFVRVTTGEQVYQSKRLIIASGAWASRMIQPTLPLRVTEQTLYWFEPRSSL
ncbi:MAG: N-methyl-L-tryptophan oxidase, partial [Planctomycetes bacterium]|nr:N-methyl-L-tryptophan oxidase [Planctomycetota bacterium]